MSTKGSNTKDGAVKVTNRAEEWFLVTPGAAALPRGTTKWLWIGGAGNVTIENEQGLSATFTAVPAGTKLEVGAYKVTAATATNILACY